MSSLSLVRVTKQWGRVTCRQCHHDVIISYAHHRDPPTFREPEPTLFEEKAKGHA